VDISGLGISGLEADDYLHCHLGVTVELAELHHLTLIVSLGNTPEDIQHCHQGFTKLAACQTEASLLTHKKIHLFLESPSCPHSRPPLSPRQAFFSPHCTLPTPQALGQVSAETIAAYPPGIPTLLAGEMITSTALEHLISLKHEGADLIGCSDPSLVTLKVVANSLPR
jgi:arginine decarboxylase